MTIEVAEAVEGRLRDLATREGCAVQELVEEALRMYVEAAALSDLTPEEVGATQMALVGELGDVPEWKGGA